MALLSLHRGWFILGISVLNLLACLGFGRFSLGAIIPFMKVELNLDYNQTGWIASSIFLGYLIGATVVGHFVGRFSAKKVIIFSLCLLAIGMFSSVVAFNFWSAYFFCLIIGLGAGSANVTSLGLVGNWFAAKYRGMALGVTNSGSGIGMVLSGLIIPMLIVMVPSDGWRVSWLFLAIAVVSIILINILFLKNTPEEVGLVAIGHQEVKSESRPRNHQVKKGKKLADDKHHIYRNKSIWAVGFIYLTWGFSYLIFSTFFIDFLMNDAHFSQTLAGRFFATAGFVSIISGFIWGTFSDRFGRMNGIFWVLLLQASLLMMFSLVNSSTILFIGTMMYGLTLWAVPTIMVAAVSDFVSAHVAPIAIGFITLFFGFGQFISPIVTGFLVESFQSYAAAMILSAIVCGLGSIGAVVLHFRQKKDVLPLVEEVRSVGQ